MESFRKSCLMFAEEKQVTGSFLQSIAGHFRAICSPPSFSRRLQFKNLFSLLLNAVLISPKEIPKKYYKKSRKCQETGWRKKDCALQLLSVVLPGVQNVRCELINNLKCSKHRRRLNSRENKCQKCWQQKDYKS